MMALLMDESRPFESLSDSAGICHFPEDEKKAIEEWVHRHPNERIFWRLSTFKRDDFSLPWLRFIRGYVVEKLRRSEYWKVQCYSPDDAYRKCFKEIWFAKTDADGQPIKDSKGNILTASLGRRGEVGETMLSLMWPFIQRDAAETYGVILENKGEFIDRYGNTVQFDLGKYPYTKGKKG
jgi:hypothetical protein